MRLMDLLLWFSSGAWGWECATNCGCDWADGGQLTYHVNVNDFTSARVVEIEKGANAWDAGATTNNRGANWDFVRGSDQTSDGTPGNWTNEVYRREDAFFAGYGLSGAVATTQISHLLCGRRDADVVFNELYTLTTDMPSVTTSANYSVGIVALHEFGHVLGLAHFDGGSATNLAFMNEFGADADIAALYRLNEDDYLGLVAGKPDASTGMNLMLQRYRKQIVSPTEVWAGPNLPYEGTWEACPGETLSAAAQLYPVLAILVGTGTAAPIVEWRLSADTTCFSGPEYVLGTVSPVIGANEPFPVTPNGGYTLPLLMPHGDYYVCAKIDATGSIAETSEVDNVIRSELQLVVHPCP